MQSRPAGQLSGVPSVQQRFAAMHAPPQHFWPCGHPGMLLVQQAPALMQVEPQQSFPCGQPDSLSVQHSPPVHVVQTPRLQNPWQHTAFWPQASPRGWQQAPPKHTVP